MTHPLSRRRLLAAAPGLAAGLALPALAQGPSWPSRPIKLVVGFAPGGLTDALPRLLTGPMAERLGQPVVVENKVGAAGNLATAFVAKSPADGYTLLASGVGQIVVLPHTSNVGVNPLTDLVHIAMVGEGDQILNINADVPARNLAEFIALAKRRPNEMFTGDAGAGGNQHLYLEYFKMLAGIQMQSVHYRGGGPLMPDLLSNRVQMSLNAPSVVEPHIAQGKLRPLMIVGRKRHPKLPDVPTAAEAGFAPMEACSNWFGLHAPRGTPDAVVQRIHKALVESLQTDAVKAGLQQMAVQAIGDTPQAFAARIASDYEAFGKVARSANIRAE
ncbi:Bug family tripartite tricarboxylate transporter substrate binding protein [Ramlibacter sp. MAHUQ-53]|uniref:Bug family tripartite tricarboxylate transporter substrate binding protein n=1 Tax=unclassified Ramlibacter TaxID=2617605 RepID=UPI003632B22C